MEDLYTVKQVAILLKVHQLTIRRYINQGKLKAIKVGGNVRISQSELRQFSEAYLPNSKSVKSNTAETNRMDPFSTTDSLFRLKGRGLSIDSFRR